METMATYGWRKKSSVKEGLFQEGSRFEFFQAVKLLEIIHKDRFPVGDDRSEPINDVVWFQGKTSLSFPLGDIDGVDEPQGKKPARMRVNFMSLTGALGPLPQAYTELVLQRIRAKDTTLRDFLDIFNNRLISLAYRVRKKFRPGFEFSPPDESQFSQYLFSLMGLGTPGLKERMEVKDRALLFYAGLLALQPRSMVGLKVILEDYFGVKVKGDSFSGRWLYLEEDQLTKIGKFGENNVLSDSALLGRRVWDQQSKFELMFESLTLKQFSSFLPLGRSFISLRELISFYTRNELDFDMTLKLKKAEVPALRIGTQLGSLLGWTSFIKTKELKQDPQTITLSSMRYNR
jgi:type VI secretion system protein ImpH